MEILKDLTKEHAVIAGIALVAGMAFNAMLQYEKMKQEQIAGMRSRESAMFYIYIEIDLQGKIYGNFKRLNKRAFGYCRNFPCGSDGI